MCILNQTIIADSVIPWRFWMPCLARSSGDLREPRIRPRKAMIFPDRGLLPHGAMLTTVSLASLRLFAYSLN